MIRLVTNHALFMVYTKPIQYMILSSMMGRHRHENRRPITGTSMALRSRQVIVSVNACLLLLLLIITPIDVGMFGSTTRIEEGELS